MTWMRMTVGSVISKIPLRFATCIFLSNAIHVSPTTHSTFMPLDPSGNIDVFSRQEYIQAGPIINKRASIVTPIFILYTLQ